MFNTAYLHSGLDNIEISIQEFGDSYVFGMVEVVESGTFDVVTTRVTLDELKEIHNKLGRFIEEQKV